MGYSGWGWILIILGTTLVATGGFLATLGWTKLSLNDQRRSVIIGVARELAHNERMIQSAIDLARRWNTRLENENFSYRPYKVSQLNNVLTSGLISYESDSDRRLLEAMERYEEAISDFNASLSIVGRHNPGLFIKVDFIHPGDNEWPEDYQSVLSDPFRKLSSEHDGFRQVLQDEFAWALE